MVALDRRIDSAIIALEITTGGAYAAVATMRVLVLFAVVLEISSSTTGTSFHFCDAIEGLGASATPHPAPDDGVRLGKLISFTSTALLRASSDATCLRACSRSLQFIADISLVFALFENGHIRFDEFKTDYIYLAYTRSNDRNSRAPFGESFRSEHPCEDG